MIAKASKIKEIQTKNKKMVDLSNPEETFLGLVYQDNKYVKKKIERPCKIFTIKELNQRKDDFLREYDSNSNFYVLSQGFGKNNIDFIYKSPNFIKPVLIYSKGTPYQWLKQDNVNKVTIDDINDLERKLLCGEQG